MLKASPRIKERGSSEVKIEGESGAISTILYCPLQMVSGGCCGIAFHAVGAFELTAAGRRDGPLAIERKQSVPLSPNKQRGLSTDGTARASGSPPKQNPLQIEVRVVNQATVDRATKASRALSFFNIPLAAR